MDISSITSTLTSVKNLKSKVSTGALVTAGLCALDFAGVPEAFKLDYNTDAEKVEGTNWKSGLKEIGKSALKCASFLVIPALITGAAVGAGPILASLAGVAALGSGFAISSLTEKLLPPEKELVAKACAEKGIKLDGADVNSESLMQVA